MAEKLLPRKKDFSDGYVDPVSEAKRAEVLNVKDRVIHPNVCGDPPSGRIVSARA